MPNSHTLRTVAIAYLVGVAWCVVLLGASLLSMEPMSGLYSAVGVEHAAVAAGGRLVLAMMLATAVAAALWYGLKRRDSSGHEGADRA